MIILEKFNSQEEKWDFQALRYAEKFGIIEFAQKNGIMVWKEKYTTEGRYHHSINLETWEHNSIRF